MKRDESLCISFSNQKPNHPSQNQQNQPTINQLNQQTKE